MRLFENSLDLKQDDLFKTSHRNIVDWILDTKTAHALTSCTLHYDLLDANDLSSSIHFTMNKSPKGVSFMNISVMTSAGYMEHFRISFLGQLPFDKSVDVMKDTIAWDSDIDLPEDLIEDLKPRLKQYFTKK